MSVGALLDAVGPGALTALAVPRGLAQTIGPPVIVDGAAAEALSGATALLLGSPGTRDLEASAAAGAAAVVVRSDTIDSQALTRAAERAGISLLAAGAHVSWGDLFSMIRTLFTVFAPGEPTVVDLFALADRVARETGGAVAIEDMSMRVVAYSSVVGQDIDDLRLAGILGRRVPEYAVEAEEYLSVLRSSGAIWSLEPSHYAPRLAIGVHAYEQAYGTIWVVQGDKPLAKDAPQVLADAAVQAAPELAKMALAADAVRRLRNDRVARLVHGIGPLSVLAAELGLGGLVGFRVVAFGTARGAADDLEATAASDLVRSALASYRVRAAVGVVAGQGIAIVGGEPRGQLADALLEETLQRVSARNGAVWRAGVSSAVAQLDGIPDAAAQARAVFDVLTGGGPQAPNVAHHAKMAPELIFHQLESWPRTEQLLEAEPLARVLAHDREHGTEFERTLQAWAATNFDTPAAAERLFLHSNTLRHRLGRIRTIVELDDPDVRLVLALQLRLRAWSNRGEASTIDPPELTAER